MEDLNIDNVRSYHEKVQNTLQNAAAAQGQLIEVRSHLAPSHSYTWPLLQTLIERLSETDVLYRRMKLDYVRETEYNRDIQTRELKLKEEIARMKKRNVRLDAHSSE